MKFINEDKIKWPQLTILFFVLRVCDDVRTFFRMPWNAIPHTTFICDRSSEYIDRARRQPNR